MICVPTVSCILAPLFYCASALHWVALRVSLSRSSSYTKLSTPKRFKSAGWESPRISRRQTIHATHCLFLQPSDGDSGGRTEHNGTGHPKPPSLDSVNLPFNRPNPLLRISLRTFFSVVAIPFFTPTRSEGRSRWTEAHSPGSDTLPQAIRRLYAYA